MTVAVSSWALHRAVGTAYWNSPESDVFEPKIHQSGGQEIENLAGVIAEHGFERLELCHFHLKSREAGYLREVRAALKDSGLTLQTLLIDDGNLTDPETGSRDCKWMRSWIEAAHELGAEGARVIAGKDAWTDETFEASFKFLDELASLGMRIRIENWFDLLQTPEHVHRLLDRLEGRVGLCVDFGNWSQPDKHRDLAQIASRAETAHAKADFKTPQSLDEEDYSKCIEGCQQANFRGPYVLVNGGSLTMEWEALDIQRNFLLKYGTKALA